MKSKKLYFIILFSFLLLFLILSFFISYNKKSNIDAPPIESFPIPSSSETNISSEVSTVAESSSISSSEEASLEKETESDMISSERFTYQPNFYSEPITDAIKERINGLSYKENCTVPYEDLRYLSILHINFNGEIATGEIICNEAISHDLLEIFFKLYEASYPIEQIRLIDDFNADDDLSCLENNTSSFNYRVVAGSTNLSKHALGLAIDINPFYNPYVTYPNGEIRISPPGSEAYADRSADFPYKIDENDLCYQLFKEHGFTWGGSWKTLKDYQHFQKAID